MDDHGGTAPIVSEHQTGWADACELADVYDKYARLLYGYCYWLLHEPSVGAGGAARAVQDTFIIVGARPGGLRDSSQLRPLLYAVARQECRRLRAALVHPDERLMSPARPTLLDRTPSKPNCGS